MMTTNPTSQIYHRGDVILVLFPNSDLRTAKRRPALIVQADHLQTGISQMIVAMISSQISRANHPSRVFVRLKSIEGIQSGILTDSIIMTDNLATIFDAAIDRRIGSLSMEKIDAALLYTLGLT